MLQSLTFSAFTIFYHLSICLFFYLFIYFSILFYFFGRDRGQKTQKTVNTRNISGMLLCWGKKSLKSMINLHCKHSLWLTHKGNLWVSPELCRDLRLHCQSRFLSFQFDDNLRVNCLITIGHSCKRRKGRADDLRCCKYSHSLTETPKGLSKFST